MQLTNSKTSYGWLAIFLHWLVVLIIAGLIGLGFYMVGLDYYDPWYKKGPNLHKSIGVSLFVVVVLRLIWRSINQQPEALGKIQWQNKVAHLVHMLLYLLLFLIMLSGYLISTADNRPIIVFELFQVPALFTSIENQEDIAGYIHLGLVISLLVALVAHIGASLKHHFVNKDKTLLRMLGK